MKNLFLTGVPRVGKTTLVRRVLNSGIQAAGGFYTEEIQERGKRVGFAIRSLDGQEGILAHVRSRSRFRVGKYGVEVESFEKIGVASIRRALSRSGLVIMDEVGRMELYSPLFRTVVLEALDSPKRVFGVLQIRRDTFLDAIRNRDDTEIIAITKANRDSVLPHLLAKLQEHT